MLLTLHETTTPRGPSRRWSKPRRRSRFRDCVLAQARRLLPAVAFLAAALLAPAASPLLGSDAALAEDIAADLTATVVELKQQELITPAEKKPSRRRSNGFDAPRRARRRLFVGSGRCAAGESCGRPFGKAGRGEVGRGESGPLRRRGTEGGADATLAGAGRRTDEGAREACAERSACRRPADLQRAAQGRQASDRPARCAS